MIKLKSVFGFVLLFSCLPLSSQITVHNLLFNSANDVVRADFSSGSPVISYTGIIGGTSLGEGIAHQENSLGNIIFWVTSNGVRDINGTLMPGSVGIITNSSSTEINIAPFPNNPNKFYILYNNQECSYLYYSVVDMTLRSGLGDVINLNTVLDNGSFAEGMELVRIPCSPNLWYLAFGCNGVGIKRYLIDNIGIHPGVAIYPMAQPSGYDGRGEFDYHNGRIGIAFAFSTTVFTANFDPVTGIVSNPITLVNPGFCQTSNTGPYGIEFSPDATKMYFSIWYQNTFNNIWRYDFTTSTTTSYYINNPTPGCYGFGQIEMGKDGKLYIVNDEGLQISVITNPNASVPVFATIPISSNTSLGISDFIQSDVYYTGQISVTPTIADICSGDSVTLTAAGDTSFVWTPVTGLSSTTGISVVAIPATTTTYTVTSSNSTSCTGSASVTINVTPSPIVSVIATDTIICLGDSTTLTASGATNYTWQPGGSTANSITVSPNATTTYTVTGVNGLNCSDIATITITVNSNPVVTATALPDTLPCSGMPTTLSAIGASTYIWQPVNLPGASIGVTPVSTTTYSVTGTGVTGCTASVSVQVVINNVVIIPVFALPATICHGDSSVISANSAAHYSWQPGGFTDSIVTVNPSVTTTYTVTGTMGSGCTGSSSVTVNVNQNPVVFITAPDDTICAGSSTNLTGNGAASYVWMPGGSTTQIVSVSPTATTTYSVIGSTLGCTGTATTSISVFDSLVITATASPDLICVGQNSNLAATGANVYFWMPTGFTADSISVSPPFTTTYTVWGNTDNCPGMNTVTVNVIPNPTVDISANDTILCPGNFLKLCAPYGFETYIWNNGSDSDCIVINAGGNYIVHVTNGMGCPATDSIYIDEACESLIWYPNSFTPNDDGKNDYFTIVGDNIMSFEIWIYNRWGELMFYSDNIEKSWDGIYHNNLVPPGTYVWYMIYESYYVKMVTYKHDLTGIVNVIR